MHLISIKGALPLAALILAALACSAPGSGAATPTQGMASDVTSEVAPPATEPPAAATPTAEVTQPPAGPPTNVDFAGTRFFFDPSLGTATGKSVPADANDGGSPSWLLPARTEFDVANYPVEGNSRAIQIVVFPVAGLTGLNDMGVQRVQLLTQMLQQKPAEAAITEDIPQLSALAQGEMIRAQVKYLDFQNGSGMRFVTQFSSDVEPVSNQGLVYVFQGLSSDGKTYVAIQMPLSQAGLGAGPDSMTSDQLNQLAQNFDQYIKDTTSALDSASQLSYHPGLDLLDQMVESFNVTTGN